MIIHEVLYLQLEILRVMENLTIENLGNSMNCEIFRMRT